ncbi:MAG: RDD family protein [Dehalococcoidia bacterium]|nr:MAG: RDD family protein [Dehalococcoidia bacterium]
MQEWLEDRPQPAGFCDGCGAPITEADRFCTACGRPTLDICSWCNATLAAGARFCTACGRPAVRARSKVYRRRAIAGKPIAGFGFRAGVYLVDNLIWSTLTNVLGPLIVRGTAADSVKAEERLREQQPATFGELMDVLGPFFWWVAGVIVVSIAIQAVWNSIGWSPAMRAIGLRIVDAHGNRPGWRRGLIRTAGTWPSALALGLGFLAAAWHPEKRTWHDRMAGTWVVDVREKP